MERDIKRAFNQVNPESAGRRAGQQFSAGASQGVNLSGVQSKMAAAGSLGAKAFGGAMTLGVAAVGTAITGTLATALSKGFDRLKTIDDAKFKLKALGNSAEDVQSIMDSALASVKGTAYGLGDAATIAASAVAAGVKPGEELTKYLKLTADTAAVAGTSLSDMGRIINQVRTSGSAYTEDLNQLADRGIPIYQWLGKAAGVAAGDVKKLAADGKISSQLLEQAIQENIGGAAKTMGQSFSGAVQNAEAALGRLGEALLKPLFVNASGGIGTITEALDELTAWINNNQGSIISFWQNVGEVALAMGQSVLSAVGQTTVSVGQLVSVLGDAQGAILKLQSGAARLMGNSEEADRLNADAEAAFGWGESMQDAGNKMIEIAAKMDRGREALRAWGDEARLAASAPALTKLGDDVSASADKVRQAFEKLPQDVPINVSAPGGQEVYDLLQKMGVQVNTNNDKEIEVAAPLAPEVLKTLEALGIKVNTDNNKLILVEQQGAEDAGQQIDAVANKEYTAVIKVLADTAAAGIDAGAVLGVNAQADGGIVPMAGGGLRMIDKPDQAGIYEGRGAGTIFAEEETGGEAYIPLAPAKRDRSTQILSEVAKIFGFTLAKSGATSTGSVSGSSSVISGGAADWSGFAGAVTGPIVSVLEQIRDTLASSSRTSPMSVKFAGSDAALLAQVPKGGRYDASGDLEKGLADCTSGIEDLVNILDGVSTSGRSMATGNAAQWLASRGFLPTDTPVAGAFNVGFNSRHMEATLPGGTNVNFGSDASVASGGVAGAAGAWGDPSFTEHYYRPVGKSWQKLAKTSDELNSTLEERTDAEKQLVDAAYAQADTVTQQVEQQGGMDGSSLGQSIVGGILQSFGLDGSLFSDPTQWANTKSLTALANWGGGMLQGIMGGAPGTDVGGGSLGLPGIPNIADFLKPLPNGAMTPTNQEPQQHTGTGALPGPAVVVNGNVGMDPRQFTQRVDAAQNQAYRRNLQTVRPG